MRRILLFICFLPLSCSTQKPVVTDPAVIQAHPKPLKIFGIGFWKPGYMILTLIDANKEYFVITTQRDDNLRVGTLFVK